VYLPIRSAVFEFRGDTIIVYICTVETFRRLSLKRIVFSTFFFDAFTDECSVFPISECSKTATYAAETARARTNVRDGAIQFQCGSVTFIIAGETTRSSSVRARTRSVSGSRLPFVAKRIVGPFRGSFLFFSPFRAPGAYRPGRRRRSFENTFVRP